MRLSLDQANGHRSYFPELDGVRAIAIAMVMAFHIAQELRPTPGIFFIGQTGVDLFFVLSGFLITGILLKAPQYDWGEVRRFYIRRTLRIFPLYYAFLLLLVLSGSRISPSFWFYIQNIYFAIGSSVSGPNHFWSLAVEEQFYLFWPFVVLFLPRRYLQPILISMIAVALLCRIPLIHWHISPFYFTLSRFDALAAGGILAVLQSVGKLASLRRSMLTVLLVAACFVAVQGRIGSITPNLAWIQITKFSVLAAFYASAIGLLLTSRDTPVLAVLKSTPLRFIGRISYGLYVFHPIVFHLVFARYKYEQGVLRITIAILATLACSLASWYLMERHLIRLKEKLTPMRYELTASPAATQDSDATTLAA